MTAEQICASMSIASAVALVALGFVAGYVFRCWRHKCRKAVLTPAEEARFDKVIEDIRNVDPDPGFPNKEK